MTTVPKPPAKPADHLKLALIPVLAVVLYSVVSSSGDESESNLEPVASASGPGTNNSATVTEATAAPDPFQNSPSTLPLPHVELATVLQHDPFALPSSIRQILQPPPVEPPPVEALPEESEPPEASLVAASPPTAPAKTVQQLMADLQRHRVSAIIHGGEGATAIVNSKVVRVGDLLDGGIRVTQISPDGVVLQIDQK